MAAAPRPILKRTSSHPPSNYPRSSTNVPVVHFPPSPCLTRTFSAHSPQSYDRSPIVVAPNTCALPERGCPGRTYVLGDAPPCSNTNPIKSRHQSVNGHLHPRGLARRQQQQQHQLHSISDEDEDTAPSIPNAPLPSLIPDTTSSSESDESDSIVSPPPESMAFYDSHSRTLHGLFIPQSSASKSRSSSDTLAFLPHPPSPPDNDKSVRSRRSSPSRRRSLRDVTVVEDDTAYHENKATMSRRTSCLSKAMSGLGMDDDAGCLAGF